MKRNFLLMLFATLLPLAGWAQHLAFTEATYSGSSEALPTVYYDAGETQVIPVSTSTYLTVGSNTRYRVSQWTYSGGSVSNYKDAGTYTAQIQRQTRSGSYSPWGSWSNYETLTFTVNKKDVTVNLYQVVREWHAPAHWNDLTVDQFGAVTTAYTVDGATWNDIKSSLSWVQLQTIENVGSYKYTFETTSAPTNYNVHINATAADLKVEQNTTGSVAGGGTGAALTYSGENQALNPGTPCAYLDGDGEKAGEVEYRIVTPSAAATDWSTSIPEAKDAETYMIEYRGVGDINHTDDAAYYTYDVTINPREIVEGTDFTAPTEKTDQVYTAAPQVIANAGAFTGKFAAELEAAGAKFQYNGGDDLPTETAVGSWSFDWDINLGTSTNFTYTVGSTFVSGATIIEADIVAADVTAPVGETGLEYILDTDQQLIATPATVAEDTYLSIPKGNVWYRVDGGTWTDDPTKIVGEHVKASDGKYVVDWYIVGNGNYKDYGSTTEPAGSFEVGIAPIQYELATTPTAATGLIYNGADQSILASGITRNTTTSPKGAIEYYIDGGAAIDGSAFANVKAKDAGEYTVTWKVVPAESKYENDYIAAETAAGDEVVVTIDKKEVIVGGNTITGTIEDLYDLKTLPAPTPRYAIADFLKDVKVLPVDNAIRDAILNEIVTITMPAFDALKLENNTVSFTAVDDAENSTNYRANVLGATGSLFINSIEAAIQEDAAPQTGLIYNGADQELVKTPAVGYKADGGTGDVAIGKVVYSLEEAGEYTDDVTKIVGKDAADTYTVYYKVELDKENKETFDRFYTYTAPVKSFTATIDQKALDLAMFEFDPATQKAVYNGSNQLPVITTVAGEPITTDDWYFEFADGKGNPIANPNEGVIDVDVYTVTLKAEADGNYKSDVSTTWEITPKAITADMFTFSEDLEYTGAALQPTISANDGNKALVEGTDYEFTVKDGDGNDVAFDNMVNAGTYTFEFTGKGNYMNELPAPTKTWTITEKPITAGMFVFSEGVTFDGSAQQPTISANDGNKALVEGTDYTFTIKDGEGNEVDLDKMIDADTYTFEFFGLGNYTNMLPAPTIGWTIAQATATIVKPTKINLTYNGKNQILVTEATSDAVAGSEGQAGAKIEYKVTFGEDVIETEDITEVVGKNAGAYTVEYSITASDKNYTNPNITGTVEGTEIQRATIGYMLGGMTKVWDGKKISEEANKEDLEKVFTLYAGELFEEDVYDVPFTLSLPGDYRDAGEYPFGAAEAQEGVQFKEGYPVNYKINFSGTGNVIIKKADLVEGTDYTVPTAVAADLTYNREPQALVEAGEVLTATATDYPNTEIAGKPFGTMLYADAEAGEYAEEAAKKTDAGDYEIWWYVKGDKNHNDTKAVKIEKSIAPKAMTFALQFETADVEFDGTDKMPADTKAYDGEVALTDADYDLAITDDATELINAGAYTFTYTGKGNYEGSSATATITIGKAPLTAEMFVLSKEEAKYTGKNQKPEVNTLLGAPITTDDYTVAADDEMVNAGTYTFTFTATAEGNYSGEVEKTFTITPLEVIAEAAAATKVYDGKEGFKDLPVITYNGLIPGEKAEDIFSVTAETFTIADSKADAGKYTFTVDPEKIVADPANYVVTAVNGNTFEITKAPLMVSWNTEAEPFTKVYGEEDPELTATAANVDVAGAIEGEEASIIQQTKITRAEGEEVGEYDVTLSAAEFLPSVFRNYAPEFTGGKGFVITKATVKVSIAALEKVYDGEAATVEVNAENVIVTGLKGTDTKDKIFTTFPTATVGDGAAVNVGTYQVTLAGGEAADYELEYIPGTFNITPAKITAATIAKQQIQEGQDVEENIDATAFTIEGVVAKDADKFFVTVNYDYQDMDGKVTAEAKDKPYTDGLIIDVDDEVKDNYEGYDAFFGELLVLPAVATVIADNADWTTEAMHAKAVTFTDRAINAGNWNVVALPFAATVKQISDAFGYAAVDVLNETASDGSIHFQVISSGTVPAYTPFIVKTTEDPGLVKDNFNQVVFYDVDIEAWPTAKNSDKAKDAANNIFWGTFMANTEIPAGSKAHWYMSKGTWYDTSARTKPVNLKAFRAYVEFDPANVAAGARIYIEEPDGTETAIDAIEFNKMINGENTYTVDGKKVSNTAQKGVYIQNGKKIAVK